MLLQRNNNYNMNKMMMGWVEEFELKNELTLIKMLKCNCQLIRFNKIAILIWDNKNNKMNDKKYLHQFKIEYD